MNLTNDMLKLAEGYQEEAYTARVGPARVKVLYDLEPLNPWVEYDAQPPVKVTTGGVYSRIETYGDIPAVEFTEAHLREHGREIADTFGYPNLLAMVKANDHIGMDWGAVNGINDIVGEILEGLDNTCTLEVQEVLYNLIGMPALFFSSTASPYGESSPYDGLVVLTPEFFECAGCDADSAAGILAAAVELYHQYANGEVFGYVIEDSEGEHLESCWGFFGDDFDANGLLHHVNSHLRHGGG